MASVMDEFEHLKIHLEELKKATNNFSSRVIGTGGFGRVYEGEVAHSKGRSIVAIKRLNREFGQGDPEFLKEIVMLSRYKHKNLISLLGYCDEDGEKILVYEHASNGSLDHHLSSTVLTWSKRLKICLDVARGLTYLHDHKGTQQRVIHRDIKSANILLDENWNAKLADLGLSKIGPANQQHTVLFTNVVGTPGYCDPQYMVTYALTKESDIYSFGVVLFEVLCGRLCFKWTNNHLEILVPMWKHSYQHKKLDQIIFKDLIPSMDPTSLRTFSDIAFQCLHDSREQRPTVSLLVKKLEIALKFQERHEIKLDDDDDMRTTRTFMNGLRFIGKGLFLGKKKTAEPIQKHAQGRSGVREAEGSGVTEAKRELVHLDGTFSFTLDDLLRGSAEVMWKSTYGTYYRAKLENGDHVAVYRLKGIPTKSKTQVEVELNFLGKIRHLNLLAMRAYYLDPNLEEKLLVYDYISKESLAAFIHATGRKQPKNWATIMQIAKGVARGLHRLHTQHHIIHGYLTPSNVILDEDNNPKISDYGLSQLIPIDTYLNTYETVGVLGYQAPELFMLEKADTKTDIYSLGVIILELLTGKSPREMKDPDLTQWVRLIIQHEWINEIFDMEILRYTSLDEEEMLNVLRLAMDCVSELPQDRPDIQLVLQQLEHKRSEKATSTSKDDGGARSSLSE